jgi:hypothetical protein
MNLRIMAIEVFRARSLERRSPGMVKLLRRGAKMREPFFHERSILLHLYIASVIDSVKLFEAVAKRAGLRKRNN